MTSDTPLRTEHVAPIVRFFEQLTPESVGQLSAYYGDDAYFKDPFNEVRSVAEIEAIFRHMFAALHAPRFVVTEHITQGAQCFLAWDFQFRFKNFRSSETQTIRGGSHLRFADDGRVSFHRDYWDAAEELYEKLPMVGGLMRWLKRQARH